jgi:hypothetical protein
MTTPAAGGQPRITNTAAKEAFRRALRDMLVLLAVLLVLGVGIGAAVAGAKGVWGALIGVALALVFSGTTVISVLRTADDPPARAIAVIMSLWLGKIVVVVLVLAVLSHFDFYSRGVLGAVLLAGVLGSAYLDLRSVQRARIPYVETSAVSPEDPTPDDGPGTADA